MGAKDRRALIGNYEKLLQIINEKDKEWVCDWDNLKQEKFFITRHECGLYYISSDRNSQKLGLIYMQESTAEHILNLISRKENGNR